jgi:hypothetical protein
MNVTEKIFALHDVDSKGWVRPGETIRVAVDWIMASEASWHVRRPMLLYVCLPPTKKKGKGKGRIEEERKREKKEKEEKKEEGR